jgi:hypothetical protein
MVPGAALAVLGVGAAVSGASAQTVLKGRVTVDTTLRPVPGAEVIVRPGDHRAVADARGEFVLGGLPGGLVHVTVRAVGFRALAADLDFPANDTLELTFELSPLAQRLDSIAVTARAAPVSAKVIEFERRRAMGFGSFFTRAQLAEWENFPLSTALRKLDNVTLIPRKWACGGGFAAASQRGGSYGVSPCMYGTGCFLSIYVDGMRVYDPAEPNPPNIDEYLTARVEAIEVYRGGGEMPAELAGTGTPCGAIVIWTRITGPR